MQGKACLIVRATVPAADRAVFDRWYREEHLPDAAKTFGAERAWRGWSRADPAVHCAFYIFPSAARAEAAQQSAGTKRLIEDFDRAWQGRVSRTREILDLAEAIPA